MISPQEAEAKVFSKASFGGGYNMAQVDGFLDELIRDYSALYKENTALKGKMKVLAEKLEEYRATEDAMRRTLLSAQKMADSMVKEAEQQKQNAIAKAESEAKTRIEEIRRELAGEELRLSAAKTSTAAYVEKLKTLYTNELEYIGNLAETVNVPGVGDPVRDIETRLSAFAATPEAVVSVESAVVTVAQPEVESSSEDKATAPNEEPERIEQEETTTLRSTTDEEFDTVVFDRLQFGKDYQFD